MEGHSRPMRVLLTKSDQDAHEVAIRYIAQTLRDAGVEVIFTRYEKIEDVPKAALEEDVAVIGVAYYGSGMMYEATILLDLMRDKDMDDVRLMLGGTITPQEKDKLLDMGVDKVFPAGSGTARDIVEYVLGAGRGN